MADNTRVNELQDKLLKAMDILNAQALNSISFDKTITCKIENDKDKKDGKYEVNDGNRIFAAYSTDTRLRAGDTVYVTVPEGNFENQKMIIGKKTADNDKPFNFTQPFDTFFDMTGHFLSEDIKGELIANSIEDRNATIENCKTSTWLVGSKDTNGDIVMADVSNKDLIKYTRLAVRADFRTWIKNAVRGEYGINIYLRTSKPKTVSAENNTKKEYGNYKYNWNNSMMYGNTYNFETYYSQEIVLDLEKQDIGRVDGVAIEFYQKANFYDKFNEPIPSSEDGFETKTMSNEYERYLNGNGYYIKQGNDLSPNIFIDNFYLSFGYDISTFTDDYVEIYTQNRNSYRRSTEVGNDYTKENQKEIKMRWVHLKDGNPVDMVAAAGKQSSETGSNYEVRWYRYSVGTAAADEYCGVYWERVNILTQEEWEKQTQEINSDTTLIEEEKNKKLQYINNVYSKRSYKYIFNPDVNKQQEKIKAIVLCDGIPYRSNELIFENEENLPPNKEAQHIANALNIVCNDKTNGNYMIYGQDNSIKDTQYGKKTRTLSAYFDTKNTGEYSDQIQQDNNLKWIFPTENSMIEVIDITIPSYKIKSYYSPNYSNNTVQCQYTLNGVVYTTEKEFTFGPAGTMGTDQTLVIDFVDDKNAVIDKSTAEKIQIQLYDNQNKLQQIPNGQVKWAWYYNSDLNEDFPKTIVEEGNAILDLNYNFNINSLYILQATIGNLTTYFPVPVRQNNSYSYIKGPTQVIYQADGEPAYNREEYKLYDSSDSIKGAKWRIRLDREGYKYTQVGNENLNQKDLEAGLYYDENYKWINPSGHILDNKNKYYTRDETIVKQRCYKNPNTTAITQIGGEDGFVAANTEKYWSSLSDSNKLQPLTIYIKDAPVYGVQAIDDSNNVLWTQPILVLQNQWPNGVVNAWDGESLKLDYETQTVLAAAISAGKKNSEDNTFSGVMMGDWGAQDVAGEIASQTGLYGFHHGAMSYAFKEDGTAFIGKSSMARINFDGSNATIYSSGYNTSAGGMMINLYNGGEPYISLKSSGNSDSDDYSEMRFDTKTSGSTIKLKRKEIEIDGIKYTGGDIIISNENTLTPLKIGSNFNVGWDGNINAQGGLIGDWKIVNRKLQSISGNMVLDATGAGSIILKKGTSKISGGILSSSTTDGRIQLDGYLEIGDGTFGYVASNAPVNSNPDGIGMSYNNSVVLASNLNAGLRHNTAYVTVTGSGKLSDGTNITDYVGLGGNYLTCTVPAEHQYGIYARFA